MDVMTRYRETMRSQLDEFGFVIQQVLPPSCLEPGFAYTAGLFQAGAPELIVFGLEHPGPLLNELGSQLQDNPSCLRPGMAVNDILEVSHPVRLDRVRPNWQWQFALALRSIEGAERSDMLQLVIPDYNSRWPEDPRCDRQTLECQPLLQREHPWLRPLTRSREVDRFADTYAGDRMVLVPVLGPGPGWEGQYEALKAERLEPGLFAITQPPCAADWVTVGSIVDTVRRPKGLRTGAHAAVVEVRDPGPRQNLAFDACLVCEPGASLVTTALCSLVAEPPAGTVTVSTTPKTFHIATDEPDAVREWLEPLVEDGHAGKRSLRCSPERYGAECDDADCALSAL